MLKKFANRFIKNKQFKLALFEHRLLIKSSFYNAIIVGVKAISGMITFKAFAYFLGPSGFALLGNLKNFTQIVSSFTAEGYQNGTIRYISEHSENEKQKNKIIATIFILSLGFAFLIGFILLLFSKTWSGILFKTEDYDYVIKVLGIGLPFLSFNLIIIYILNGLERYKKLVVVNSVLSIGNTIISVLFIIKYGLAGGLIAVIMGPVAVFVINLFALGEDRVLLYNAFRLRLFSFDVVKKMNVYLLMSIYATTIVSITFLLIRNLIIEKLGTVEAGYWEAMNRLSAFYLIFFISLTSFYLLPRLSKINEWKVFKKELKGFYTFIIPALLICFTLIYLLRFFLLRVFLSEEFLPTSTLFFWQLIGDFISVLAIALVKQFHAKLMVKAYLICNGITSISYFGLSYIFIDIYGLVGVVKAHALSYLIYLFIVSTFVFHYYKRKNNA
ncbi:O-antigen translocase [Geojedonia litorea]|uniref:O-antigen translocase n=1 Tax=Geojedonia litorea TaxID=1268269 RepID=A0ABV9N244_9FLAO